MAAPARRLISRGLWRVCHLLAQATGHRQRRCASVAGLQVMAREPEQLLPPDLQHAAQLMVDAGCRHAWPVASGHVHLLWWDQPEAGMGDTIKVTPCWKSAPSLRACQLSPVARMPMKPIPLEASAHGLSIDAIADGWIRRVGLWELEQK